MFSWRRLTALVGLGLLACSSARNYVDPSGPRYAGRFASPAPGKTELRLVSFNIRFASQIERALALFRTAEPLRGADVVVLQEMDEPGTRRLAAALGLDYVYYPAVVHPDHGRDFGNAILSRWPIEDDRKIILPHLARSNGAQRVAVAGTIRVGGRPVRVYSVHLGSRLEVGSAGQREQAEAVLADAARFERSVVAGDLNGRSIGSYLEERGMLWVTEHTKPTLGLLGWDHILVRGLEPRAVEVVRDNLGASDHRPVWAVLALE